MTAPGPERRTPFEQGSVRGFLHTAQVPRFGMVLTHGAGSNCDSPLLRAVACAFAENEVSVLRCDLPFRQRRSKGPPHPSVAAQDRAGLHEAAMILQDLLRVRVILAGHSYGGRQASMLAAEEPSTCSALLLLSYPLHPPAKPLQLRTAHFAQLTTPSLFVHGTQDPFASEDELRSAIMLIPAPTTTSLVTGAGHDLAKGRFDLSAIVVQPLKQMLTRLASA